VSSDAIFPYDVLCLLIFSEPRNVNAEGALPLRE
jgi:hypothetical protein